MQQPVVAISTSVINHARTVIRDVLADTARLIILDDPDPARRLEVLRQADALIAGFALNRELTSEQFAEAGQLRLIQFLGAGVDSVDFSAIPGKVVIASNPGASAKPIAEHVMAMTLALAKRLPQRHAALARGEFDQRSPSLTLDGAVCAILGFGGIGARTATLMRPFGARIHAVNTSGRTTEPVEWAGTLADLDKVLATADVLVLALPMTRAIRGMIGRRELALMKPNAILVNVARGGIIDEGALYEHLRANPDFSAGIDAWWQEPVVSGSFSIEYPFLELPNVLGSPHNSSVVAGSLTHIARQAAENVRRFLAGQPPARIVRQEDYSHP